MSGMLVRLPPSQRRAHIPQQPLGRSVPASLLERRSTRSAIELTLHVRRNRHRNGPKPDAGAICTASLPNAAALASRGKLKCHQDVRSRRPCSRFEQRGTRLFERLREIPEQEERPAGKLTCDTRIGKDIDWNEPAPFRNRRDLASKHGRLSDAGSGQHHPPRMRLSGIVHHIGHRGNGCGQPRHAGGSVQRTAHAETAPNGAVGTSGAQILPREGGTARGRSSCVPFTVR
jgi:hypothetical protein